jgi:hypothetical protein
VSKDVAIRRVQGKDCRLLPWIVRLAFYHVKGGANLKPDGFRRAHADVIGSNPGIKFRRSDNHCTQSHVKSDSQFYALDAQKVLHS